MQNNSNTQISVAKGNLKLTTGTGKVLSTSYSLDRAKTSQAFAEGSVLFRRYTITPQVNIVLDGSYPDIIICDILNAIDIVLSFHKK